MRVVVAEDVMLTREGITRLLTDAGVDVAATAGDAAALLRAVRTTQPGAAVADIRMPPARTGEGLAAAQQIRAEHPGVNGCPGPVGFWLRLRSSGSCLGHHARPEPRRCLTFGSSPGSPC
jgi:DNA-binding NarL/FixJ family response regulator